MNKFKYRKFKKEGYIMSFEKERGYFKLFDIDTLEDIDMYVADEEIMKFVWKKSKSFEWLKDKFEELNEISEDKQLEHASNDEEYIKELEKKAKELGIDTNNI